MNSTVRSRIEFTLILSTFLEICDLIFLSSKSCNLLIIDSINKLNMGLSVLQQEEDYLKGLRPSRLGFLKKYLVFLFLTYLGYLGLDNFSAIQSFLDNLIGFNLPSDIKPVFFLPALLLLIWNEYKIWSVKYHLTDQRVVVEKGILNKSYESIAYDKITDTVLEEDVSERIFSLGDISLNTAGSEEYEVKLKGIGNPKKTQNLLDKNIKDTTSLSDESIKGLSMAMKDSQDLLQELNDLRNEMDSLEREKDQLKQELESGQIAENDFKQEISRINQEEREINDRISQIKNSLLERGHYEDL